MWTVVSDIVALHRSAHDTRVQAAAVGDEEGRVLSSPSSPRRRVLASPPSYVFELFGERSAITREPHKSRRPEKARRRGRRRLEAEMLTAPTFTLTGGCYCVAALLLCCQCVAVLLLCRRVVVARHYGLRLCLKSQKNSKHRQRQGGYHPTVTSGQTPR